MKKIYVDQHLHVREVKLSYTVYATPQSDLKFIVIFNIYCHILLLHGASAFCINNNLFNIIQCYWVLTRLEATNLIKNSDKY